MRLVKIALGGVGALIILFVGFSFLLPRETTIARTIVIDAPAATVFGIVNGFERFPEWSPWQELDPQQRIELRGPTTGPGAVMVWASDDPNVGTGRQEIIEVEPDRRVVVSLQFDDFPPARSEITLTPRGPDSTVVTWSLHLDFGYRPVYRWVGLFFDGMVGPDYERGLERLKSLAEM